MAYDKIDELYDALSKDGAVSKDRDYFRAKMLAPGKEGYQNRLQLYGALKADGAVSSPTYEAFAAKLGLHAVAPAKGAQKQRQRQQTTPAKPQPTKPQQGWTAAQRKQAEAQLEQNAYDNARLSQRWQQQSDNLKRQVKRLRRLGPDFAGEAQARAVARKAGIEEPTTSLLGTPSAAATAVGVVKGDDGKWHNQYELEDGSLTTDFGDVMHANELHDLRAKMDRHGLDPEQATDDDIMKMYADEAYDAALQADRVANQQAVDEDAGRTPLETMKRAVMNYDGDDDQMRDAAREINRAARLNPDAMVAETMRRMPPSVLSRLRRAYGLYFEQHPKALRKGQNVQQAAEEAIKGSIYRNYNKLVAAHAPKSTLEYLMRRVADQPLFSQHIANQTAAAAVTGNHSQYLADEQAMSGYGNEHPAAEFFGMVGNMAADPITYAGGWVGGLAAKTIARGIGKAVVKNAGEKMAGRLAGRTLAGRIAQGVAAGAGLATFEAGHEAQRQVRSGDFSARDVLGAGGRGVLLGMGTGLAAPLIGNVADKVVARTASTGGKLAARAGETATSVLAEGTIFAAPELVENAQLADDDPNKRSGWSIWAGSLGTMAGFKGQHMIKAAPRVLAELRTDGARRGVGFEGRLRNMLDRTPADLQMSKADLQELRDRGYGGLAQLYARWPNPPAYMRGLTEKEEGVQRASVESTGRDKDLDGYATMQRLMKDHSVSAAVRAKAYYLLTGKMLPMPTVLSYDRTVNEDGSITITALGVENPVPAYGSGPMSRINSESGADAVVRKTFKSKKEADVYEAKVRRQIELNSVDVGEQLREAQVQNDRLDAAITAVYPNGDRTLLKNHYYSGKNKTINDALDEYMNEHPLADENMPRSIKYTIERLYGVDIDKALKKEPNRRDTEEAAAVQAYVGRLYDFGGREEGEAKEVDGSGPAGVPPAAAPEDITEQAREEGRKAWAENDNGEDDVPLQGAVDEKSARVREALDRLDELFDEEAVSVIKDDPNAMLNSPMLSEEHKAAIREYAEAMAGLDGVKEAAQEAAEQNQAEVENEVVKSTNKETKLLMPATMKDDSGNPVSIYVVDGKLVLNTSGGVDPQESAQTIVVYDPSAGKYRFVDPKDIIEMGQPVSPADAVQAATEAIQQRHKSIFDNAELKQLPAPKTESGEGEKPVEAEQPETTPAAEGEPKQPIPMGSGALGDIPRSEKGEPVYEQAEPATAWQAILEETGGDTDMAASVVDDMIADKEAAVKKAEKAKPKHADTVAGKIAAQKERKAAIERAKAELEAWKKIAAAKAVHDDAVAERKSAEAKRQDEQRHEAAVAQAEQDKAEKQRKEEEQKAVGTHAVNPKIKKKWDESNKIEGNANVIVLPDGSKLRGHYVLTEAGAATASHDASNGFEPTEGFPVDENGQSVNDRDYSRDKDAQRMVDEMANGFDSRALQSPVIVSQDGVVLSGNNRTMSGDIAAKQGTDKAYVDHLREFGQMYGFAPEQIDGMQHPRVVFVPDESLPYDAATFARFNAETQKRQSKPEHAVKLGKIVPDNVFGSIATAIGGYDRLSDFYADSNAVNEVLKRLFDAGVINEMQLPELRTGNALSAAGKELIENLLVGKAFQGAPDAVRQLIAEPNVKQAVVMALSEIAHNRTLEKSGYSLGKELAAAIDLVYRARKSNPDMYKNGVPVSPFGRQLGLFDGQGDQAVTDGAVLLLADLLSSGKTSDLRKVLAACNAEATESASGQADIFSGKVLSKEEILKTVTEHFKNATRGEQKKLVDAAVDKRKQAAAERGGRGKESEQTEHAAERGEKGGSREPKGGGRPDSQTYKVDNQGNPIDNEEETPLSEQIATASADVNTEPTEGQKEAGNYKKGHVQVGAFDITIEQPKGSVRKGTDANGKQWESKMHNTYGYFRGTEGVDGDHIDVFLSNDIDGWNGRKVYVVDQYNPDGTFDEHKVMLGFNDADEAKSDYLANYEKGWEDGRRIDVSAVNLEDFEKWIESSKRKTKPFGEYSSVKKDVVEINAPANEDTPSEIQTLLRERGCTPISQEHRNLTDEGVVADNASNPIILYHGTLDKSISVSELEAGHKRADGESADFAGSGVYFTPNKDVAEEYGYNGQVFEAHVKLSKPFYMLGNPGFNESEAVQFSNLLKSKGYDGIINYMNAWSVEHNMIDGGEVVVFNNSSILPIEKGQNNHAGYSITPTTYTNKKGKTTDMSLLKFDNELTPEQERAVKEFAKERTGEGRFAPARGWKDRESGGWMFRSEEDARKAAEMVGSDEAVADNQPLTAQELREAVGPKKPVARNEAAASKPANKVEIADVVKQKPNEPTEAAEPAKEEKTQYEVSDEEMQGLMNDIRDILGIDDSEGDSGMLFRDPDELTPKERQKLMSVGQRLAMALVERGNESFGEYAIAMVSALGSKVRPWLKAFYGGLEYVPGYEKYALTPYDEVKAFDVENFDKPHNSGPLKQAQMMVEEGKAQTTAAKANNELKEIRNEQRKETEKQTAADTDAVAAEAETDISEAETHETTSGDRRAVSGATERVDGTLDKVNGQLALLGYYEAERVGKDFNEAYGYMRNAEKKAVKDAANLASQLIDDLGLDRYEATHGEADKKGKRKTKPLAVANIAPTGGDVTMHLPLAEGRELYVNIQLAPSAGKGITNYDGDNLEVTGVMCRVENPSGKGNDRYGQNMWFAEDVTYDELLKNVQRVAYRYIPERTDVVEGEYRVGDKVQYSPDGETWRDAVVAQPNELGGIRIDTGLAPVMWVNATPEQLRHKPAEATAQDVPQSERKKKDGQAAAAPKKNGNFAKEQQVGDLFAGLFNEQQNNNDNGQLERNRGQVRAQGVRADNSGQQQRLPESERGSGERTPQEGGRADTRRGGQGPVQNRTESAGLHGLKPQQQQKNTRNNHSERGEDHAPVSVDARIDANIRAIELARNLLESGDTATPEQMSVLRRYSGWGGLGSAFNSDDHSWRRSERNKKLRELLGPEAYEQAVMSANSAYYTPAYVVDTLWDIARQLGFKGGSILEGSAGIGNILGQMPTEISGASDIHAIEIDGTSGGILSLLYPDAHVDIQGFEKTRIPNGSVDLAITNVPFVTGLRVSDTTGDGDLSKKFHNIHDFCIAKNVRKLREGGIGIFISSAGTLDNSKALRDWVVNEGGSDFIGAFRMNNKTFGGTTVTSDIIVVRKRVNGHKSPQAIDVSTIGGERTAEYTEPGGKTKLLPMDYNKYFIEHPERMAGVMRFGFEEGDTYRPASKGLFPEEGKDQGRMLADFVSSLKEENEGEPAVSKAEETSVVRMGGKGHGKKVGEMFMKDGKIVVADSSHHYHELALNDKKIKGHTKEECFGAYTAIKDALSEVMKYQSENKDDAGLKPLLDKLNKAYDNFVSTYGHFNKNNQLAWLRSDVDYPNVFSLETYNEQGDGKGGVVKTYGKADVMKDRVVEKGSEPNPKNVKDGVVVSMFKNGRIDVPYIAGQLGRSEEDVTREIIGNGLGFENPTTRQVEVSFQYLSGNVREKLKQAEANNTNGEYDANIKALRDVVPMDIPSHLIDFSLGSSWLDPKLYEEYVEDRTGISVKFTTAGGTWYMDAPKYRVATQKNRAAGVTSEKLERTVLGHELIEAAIQNKTISMTKTKKHWDGTTETIVDRDATQACSDKIEEIRQDFKDWARQKMQADPELSGRIEREYNDRFNNYVPMKIPKEFAPEHFEGATRKLKMREHQSRAIVRGTMQPLMLAHEVGTGKTYTLISTAMEMRRLGTARKPMIVVQNATVGQFVKDAKELYPGAKILALGDSDRNAEGRRKFYAKIKYNDWDMVIVPQSAFEFIPDSEERQMQFIQDKIDEKMLVLEQMRKADTGGRDPLTRRAENELVSLQADIAALTAEIERKRTGKNSGMTAAQEKKRAVAKQNTAVKAQEMLDRRTDDVENFDDMGIDALLVDEAHEYKHLGFSTAMQRGVKGVDPSYSKKSQGVYLKAQAVLEKSNGRNVIFATGTPISNTAAEIWTFMRYLMPKDTMKEYGIFYFDDFVRNFGNIQQMPEFTASGKFKEVNRFAGYVNLPELVRIWSSVADTVLTKDQKELANKIPDMEGGKAQDIYLPQTRALRSVMKYVKARLDEYDKMSGKEKKENSHIPLTMYGIAKAAAVDARLVLADAEDDPHSKTNEAVRQTLRTLKETDGYKGTVAIFADNYQNKRSGFNLYEDIKKKLVAQGVPESEVVVMKPGMTIKKKQDIFDKVNRGEVRVVLGSTATLGTGVNIQERLHTLIHLDAPNRPMDYTQRNGRILRQGNLHKKWGKPVRVLRFGVEDSLDVTAYQRLKTKGAIADSIMEGEKLMNDSMNNRVLEEEEDVFGDTVAQLSGSEYALLKNNAEKNVRKYESRKRQWEADQIYIHNAKPRLEGLIRADEQRAEESKRQLQVVQGAFHGGKFKMITAGNNKFGSVEEMADFIKTHNKQVLADSNEMKTNASVGKKTKTLTLSVDGHEFKIKTELSKETTSAGGELFSEVRRKMTYSCAELGLEDVPVKQGLLRNAVEDIADNVITGKDFAERLDAAEQSARHNRAELEAMKKREGKPFEFSKELEKSQQQLEEYTEAMKEELAEKERKYASMDASVEEAQDVAVDTDDTDDAADADEGKRFRLLDDDDPQAQELEALPESELVPVYRNVQVFDDDTLGSPMAFSDAATGERRTLEGGKWNYSEPREVKLTPEQQKQLDELNRNGYLTVNGKRTNELPIGGGLKFVKPKTKPAQLQYFLKKSPEDSGLWAAYNPYDHAIETPLNTQFGEAYKRPNLVVVRSLMPKSELEGHYMADYAKDSTGAHKWNNGRTLYLSRYSKIDKVLTREEEAQLIDEYWKKNPGKREALASHRDYRRFVPEVRKALEKMGYRFEFDGRELTPEEALELDRQQENAEPAIPGEEGRIPRVNAEDIARINAKMSGKWVGEPKETLAQAMVRRVKELAAKLGAKVRIVTSADELAKSPTGRQRKMKGMYDTETGEITIVVGNHENLADVENTMLHEAVGHGGFRVLFDTKEKLGHAMDELYRVSGEKIRKWIDGKMRKLYDSEVDRIMARKRKERMARGEKPSEHHLEDMAAAHIEASSKKDEFRRIATEEYGANLAGRIGEKGFEKMSAEEQTFWGRLKSMLQKALQRLSEGLNITGKHEWTDKDWAYVLHEAYKRERNGGKPGIFDKADTIAMRMRTGFGEGERKQEERKNEEEDPGTGMMFRDGDDDDIGDVNLGDAVNKMRDAAVESNANNLHTKREAMKAIGGNLSKLRQAMSRQKVYDKGTVKSVTDMAREMLQNGMLDKLSSYEAKRILSAAANVTGAENTTKQINKLMDVMVDNQLRNAADTFGKLLHSKGTRVNASGVEVQGKLDHDGAAIVDVLKKGVQLDKDELNERIAKVLDKIGSEDKAIADQAANELTGLQLAARYAEDIKGSKTEEAELRESLKEAKAQKDAGQMSAEAYKQYCEATEDAMRQNKIERADAYRQLIAQLGGVMGESAERAKAWREAEKQRVQDIQHNANSDMQGRPCNEHHKPSSLQKLCNSDFARALLKPLATFEQMLRMFGNKNVRGEGYLWNRFVRGWLRASENEYSGYRDALKELDDKVSEIFGKKMRWGDIFSLERKMPTMEVSFWDGGEMKHHTLTQGNLAYIYMVDKMSDGRMKLRAMGITDEAVEQITKALDPRLKKLADWMQDEFLVQRRNKYNEVHKRMFGASMAAIENYFPLKILSGARTENVDVADDTGEPTLTSTTTGSIIKRRRNNLALDVTNADAFSVILEHLQDMEHWAAYSEFNRDLNTLLSYKRFKNQVMNMSSAYGAGETLWKNFRNVCQLAAGSYRPPVADLDKAMVNFAKSVTAAKISFRVFTALKQLLSFPAYLPDASAKYLVQSLANPVSAWKWSMENLPLFHKRWNSRMAGDPRLLKTEMDWKMWRSRAVQLASKYGMSPNAFVDAVTVAMGAHAIYKTKLAKYIKQGYDKSKAEEKARQDAEIAYNQTQQSSEGAFLSTMQADRSWLSVLFTVFRNSAMSYTRQEYDALRNLARKLTTKGYKEKSIAFMAKQMVRDGLDENTAWRNATREYSRSTWREFMRVATFGYILQLVWNLGAYLPYLLLGDDGDDKKKMLEDAVLHALVGSVEGLTGGDVMSTAGQYALTGNDDLGNLTKEMPLTSDLYTIYEKFGYDKMAACNDVVNLLVQAGVGVNPQSLTDAVVGVMDYCDADPKDARECALLIARIFNTPQSQLDKIYFDEIDLDGKDASKLSPQQIAERYAKYKMKRNTPLTSRMYGEDGRKERVAKYEVAAYNKAKEKLSAWADSRSGEDLTDWFDEYKQSVKTVGRISKLEHSDPDKFDEEMTEFYNTPAAWRYDRINDYMQQISDLTKQWQSAKTRAERMEAANEMVTAKKDLAEDLKEIK